MSALRLWAGGETHRGHIRDTNQDVILVEPDLGLYAVLDGMGGANAGDVAASMASQEIAASMRKMSRIRRRSPRKALELALNTAAVEVFMAAEQRLDYRGMGTTVVACLVIEPTHVVIGHAGDSRAYLLRDGKLGALTRDHTVAQRLVDAGALRADEMESCPQRHLLTRNLGREYGVGPDVLELKLKRGDRLLLCSDGLYGGAPLGAIRRVLGSGAAPTRVARRLIELVLRGEASDNISAIVLAVDDGPAPAAKPRRSSRNQVRQRGKV
jgi:protein phosphatase